MDKDIKLNIAYNMFYHIVTMLTPLIVAPYLSRVLGAAPLGIYSFTNVTNSYFVLIANLGAATYGNREISRLREDAKAYSKTFWEIQFIRLLTTTIALGLWGLIVLEQRENRVLYFVFSINIIASFFDITWFFAGLEKFKLTVVRNTACKMLEFILILLLVNRPEDLIAYIVIVCGTNLCAHLILWIQLPHVLVRTEKIICRGGWKKHIREIWMYFIPTIATSMHVLLDKSLIGIITHSEAQNGYYLQAEKLINLAKSLVFTAIGTVVGTRMSYLYAINNQKQINYLIYRSMGYILFVGVGLSCGIGACAENFVPIFFGSDFRSVTPILRMLAPVITVVGISNCMETHYYIPSGNRKVSTRYLIFGALLNIVGNLMLIPKYKALGAAVSTLVSEIVITMLYLTGARKNICVLDAVRRYWKIFISGIVMYPIGAFVDIIIKNNPILGLIFQIMACGIGYIVVLFVLSRKEMAMLLGKK